MDGLTSVAADGAWSYGASILTFAFPMILFVAVAGALYVLYTKPHLVPGHRYLLENRSAAMDTAPVTPPAPSAAAGEESATTAAPRQDAP